jgi:hypothetical protein
MSLHGSGPGTKLRREEFDLMSPSVMLNPLFILLLVGRSRGLLLSFGGVLRVAAAVGDVAGDVTAANDEEDLDWPAMFAMRWPET